MKLNKRSVLRNQPCISTYCVTAFIFCIFATIVVVFEGQYLSDAIGFGKSFDQKLKGVDRDPTAAVSTDVVADTFQPLADTTKPKTTKIKPGKAKNIRRKDCCKEECKITTEILKKPNCPEKYFGIYPYGSFNNALRQLISAIHFSAHLNRTIIIGDNFGYKLNDLIDTGDICFLETTGTWIKDLHAAQPFPLRTIYWDPECRTEINDFHSIPIERIELDGQLYRTYARQPKLQCILQSIPSYNEDTLIFLPRTFFVGMTKEQYLAGLQHISFKPPVHGHETRKFISESLGGQKFVGVHMRWFEGTCHREMRKAFGGGLAAYLDDAMRSCEMNWDYVAKIMNDNGYDPSSTLVFLASDGQRGDLVDEFKRKQNVRVWDVSFLPQADHRMVDMYILANSSLFIGNSYSSFSFHVALWREVAGHDASTNILPAYREKGYLEHFFS